MTRRLINPLISFVSVFLISSLSIGQQQGQSQTPKNKQIPSSGKTLAVNLVMEPGDDPEGITIMTADGLFTFNSALEKGEGRTEISFQGNLEQSENDRVMVRYHLTVQGFVKADQKSQRIDVQGSVIVKMDDQIMIAKSKERTFKLKLTVVK